MYNLLTEPLIRFDKPDGSRPSASLPEVYAALMGNQVEAFPALRPHQRHAWHAFLVQLGAMAMHRAGLSEPPDDAETWCRIIGALTPDHADDEPWQLMVDDITKPAFMQPPSTGWANYDKKELFRTPDFLDMLDTAKNHDLKNSMATDAKADDWVFALIAMQTMNGQVGRGNYPIARMNSGDGSRTAFSVAPSLRPGIHVLRDITVILERAAETFEGLPYQWDGIGLLWTERWDGQKELIPLAILHPFHIEICRRRRLCMDANGRMYALKAASDGRLIAAGALRGVVGDPWTLVSNDEKGPKALTLQADSFNYRNVTKYLTSPEWELPALFSPTEEERSAPAVYLVMRGIRRTKGGQTERYHERIIPFRRKSVQVFGRPGGPEQLGDIARERVGRIGIVQGILRSAIATFACNGNTKKANELLRKRENPLRKRVDELANTIEEKVDAHFFEDFQFEFEAPENERELIRSSWIRDFVIPVAEGILSLAHNSLPTPQSERFHAYASSQNLFDGSIRKAFPTLSIELDEENHNAS